MLQTLWNLSEQSLTVLQQQTSTGATNKTNPSTSGSAYYDGQTASLAEDPYQGQRLRAAVWQHTMASQQADDNNNGRHFRVVGTGEGGERFCTGDDDDDDDDVGGDEGRQGEQHEPFPAAAMQGGATIDPAVMAAAILRSCHCFADVLHYSTLITHTSTQDVTTITPNHSSGTDNILDAFVAANRHVHTEGGVGSGSSLSAESQAYLRAVQKIINVAAMSFFDAAALLQIKKKVHYVIALTIRHCRKAYTCSSSNTPSSSEHALAKDIVEHLDPKERSEIIQSLLEVTRLFNDEAGRLKTVHFSAGTTHPTTNTIGNSSSKSISPLALFSASVDVLASFKGQQQQSAAAAGRGTGGAKHGDLSRLLGYAAPDASPTSYAAASTNPNKNSSNGKDATASGNASSSAESVANPPPPAHWTAQQSLQREVAMLRVLVSMANLPLTPTTAHSSSSSSTSSPANTIVFSLLPPSSTSFSNYEDIEVEVEEEEVDDKVNALGWDRLESCLLARCLLRALCGPSFNLFAGITLDVAHHHQPHHLRSGKNHTLTLETLFFWVDVKGSTLQGTTAATGDYALAAEAQRPAAIEEVLALMAVATHVHFQQHHADQSAPSTTTTSAADHLKKEAAAKQLLSERPSVNALAEVLFLLSSVYSARTPSTSPSAATATRTVGDMNLQLIREHPQVQQASLAKRTPSSSSLKHTKMGDASPTATTAASSTFLQCTRSRFGPLISAGVRLLQFLLAFEGEVIVLGSGSNGSSSSGSGSGISAGSRSGVSSSSSLFSGSTAAGGDWRRFASPLQTTDRVLAERVRVLVAAAALQLGVDVAMSPMYHAMVPTDLDATLRALFGEGGSSPSSASLSTNAASPNAHHRDNHRDLSSEAMQDRLAAAAARSPGGVQAVVAGILRWTIEASALEDSLASPLSASTTPGSAKTHTVGTPAPSKEAVDDDDTTAAAADGNEVSSPTAAAAISGASPSSGGLLPGFESISFTNTPAAAATGITGLSAFPSTPPPQSAAAASLQPLQNINGSQASSPARPGVVGSVAPDRRVVASLMQLVLTGDAAAAFAVSIPAALSSPGLLTPTAATAASIHFRSVTRLVHVLPLSAWAVMEAHACAALLEALHGAAVASTQPVFQRFVENGAHGEGSVPDPLWRGIHRAILAKGSGGAWTSLGRGASALAAYGFLVACVVLTHGASGTELARLLHRDLVRVQIDARSDTPYVDYERHAATNDQSHNDASISHAQHATIEQPLAQLLLQRVASEYGQSEGPEDAAMWRAGLALIEGMHLLSSGWEAEMNALVGTGPVEDYFRHYAQAILNNPFQPWTHIGASWRLPAAARRAMMMHEHVFPNAGHVVSLLVRPDMLRHALTSPEASHNAAQQLTMALTILARNPQYLHEYTADITVTLAILAADATHLAAIEHTALAVAWLRLAHAVLCCQRERLPHVLLSTAVFESEEERKRLAKAFVDILAAITVPVVRLYLAATDAPAVGIAFCSGSALGGSHAADLLLFYAELLTEALPANPVAATAASVTLAAKSAASMAGGSAAVSFLFVLLALAYSLPCLTVASKVISATLTVVYMAGSEIGSATKASLPVEMRHAGRRLVRSHLLRMASYAAAAPNTAASAAPSAASSSFLSLARLDVQSLDAARLVLLRGLYNYASPFFYRILQGINEKTLEDEADPAWLFTLLGDIAQGGLAKASERPQVAAEALALLRDLHLEHRAVAGSSSSTDAPPPLVVNMPPSIADSFLQSKQRVTWKSSRQVSDAFVAAAPSTAASTQEAPATQNNSPSFTDARMWTELRHSAGKILLKDGLLTGRALPQAVLVAETGLVTAKSLAKVSAALTRNECVRSSDTAAAAYAFGNDASDDNTSTAAKKADGKKSKSTPTTKDDLDLATTATTQAVESLKGLAQIMDAVTDISTLLITETAAQQELRRALAESQLIHNHGASPLKSSYLYDGSISVKHALSPRTGKAAVRSSQRLVTDTLLEATRQPTGDHLDESAMPSHVGGAAAPRSQHTRSLVHNHGGPAAYSEVTSKLTPARGTQPTAQLSTKLSSSILGLGTNHHRAATSYAADDDLIAQETSPDHRHLRALCTYASESSIVAAANLLTHATHSNALATPHKAALSGHLHVLRRGVALAPMGGLHCASILPHTVHHEEANDEEDYDREEVQRLAACDRSGIFHTLRNPVVFGPEYSVSGTAADVLHNTTLSALATATRLLRAAEAVMIALHSVLRVEARIVKSDTVISTAADANTSPSATPAASARYSSLLASTQQILQSAFRLSAACEPLSGREAKSCVDETLRNLLFTANGCLIAAGSIISEVDVSPGSPHAGNGGGFLLSLGIQESGGPSDVSDISDFDVGESAAVKKNKKKEKGGPEVMLAHCLAMLENTTAHAADMTVSRAVMGQWSAEEVVLLHHRTVLAQRNTWLRALQTASAMPLPRIHHHHHHGGGADLREAVLNVARKVREMIVHMMEWDVRYHSAMATVIEDRFVGGATNRHHAASAAAAAAVAASHTAKHVGSHASSHVESTDVGATGDFSFVRNASSSTHVRKFASVSSIKKDVKVPVEGQQANEMRTPLDENTVDLLLQSPLTAWIAALGDHQYSSSGSPQGVLVDRPQRMTEAMTWQNDSVDFGVFLLCIEQFATGDDGACTSVMALTRLLWRRLQAASQRIQPTAIAARRPETSGQLSASHPTPSASSDRARNPLASASLEGGGADGSIAGAPTADPAIVFAACSSQAASRTMESCFELLEVLLLAHPIAACAIPVEAFTAMLLSLGTDFAGSETIIPADYTSLSSNSSLLPNAAAASAPLSSSSLGGAATAGQIITGGCAEWRYAWERSVSLASALITASPGIWRHPIVATLLRCPCVIRHGITTTTTVSSTTSANKNTSRLASFAHLNGNATQRQIAVREMAVLSALFGRAIADAAFGADGSSSGGSGLTDLREVLGRWAAGVLSKHLNVRRHIRHALNLIHPYHLTESSSQASLSSASPSGSGSVSSSTAVVTHHGIPFTAGWLWARNGAVPSEATAVFSTLLDIVLWCEPFRLSTILAVSPGLPPMVQLYPSTANSNNNNDTSSSSGPYDADLYAPLTVGALVDLLREYMASIRALCSAAKLYPFNQQPAGAPPPSSVGSPQHAAVGHNGADDSGSVSPLRSRSPLLAAGAFGRMASQSNLFDATSIGALDLDPHALSSVYGGGGEGNNNASPFLLPDANGSGRSVDRHRSPTRRRQRAVTTVMQMYTHVVEKTFLLLTALLVLYQEHADISHRDSHTVAEHQERLLQIIFSFASMFLRDGRLPLADMPATLARLLSLLEQGVPRLEQLAAQQRPNHHHRHY